MLSHRCTRSVMTKNWHQFLFGVLILMTTTSGCATGRMTEMRIPGNPNLNDYCIHFETDWDVFETGTFSYDPSDTRKLHMSTRCGYQDFYILKMDFKFKNGREYHEKIDMRPLIREMVEQHKIFDLSKTKWGGGARLIITINIDKLSIEYLVYKRIKKENPKRLLSKKLFYPVFEKTLD